MKKKTAKQDEIQPEPAGFEQFREKLGQMVARFDKNLTQYKSSAYDEASLRQEFLNPLFRALGWDIENEAGLIPQHREVETESRTEIAGRQKRADYLFRTDRQDRFVCEAKKPAEELHARYAFQSKRYAWNKGLVLAVLSDFEEMKIYIVGSRPHPDEADAGLWKAWHFQKYPQAAREMWDLLSRNAVASGSIDKLVDSLPRKPVAKGKARQQWLFKPDRTRALDADFLNFLDEARRSLASDLLRSNNRADLLEGTRLDEAVQRILDRILFLRICEDRDIDTGRPLANILKLWRSQFGQLPPPRRVREAELSLYGDETPPGFETKLSDPAAAYRVRNTASASLWREVVAHLRALDRRPPSHIPFFNGNLFKPHFSEELEVSDEWISGLLDEIGDEESPYLFNVIPVEMLGTIYERFLGKTIRPKGRGVAIEEKPEVRKAGGVYYTPRYIVDYIVEQTIGKLLEDRTPKESLALRILDPACGSGSFLIRSFERICEHWQAAMMKEPKQRRKQDCWTDPETGDVHLTTDLKRRILTANIYGVDLDAGAVEVTQLSLYLKMLEGENRKTLARERDLFGSDTPLLPPLQDNIKCGNSLISSDFSLDPDDITRVRAFDWNEGFLAIMKNGGFDAVIGNPPYGAYLDETHKEYLNSHYSFQTYQLDSYLLFLERCLRDLIRKGGLYGMIIPNPWLTNILQTTTRRFVCEKCRIHQIVHFKYPVFHGVTVDTQIVIMEKSEPANWTARVFVVSPADKIGDAFSSAPSMALSHKQEKWRKLDGGVINIFTSEKEEALAAKILQQSSHLDSFCDINVGIKPYQTGKGEPKQTKQTVLTRPFDSDKKITKRHRAYLRGSDIARYIVAPLETRFIDYGPWLAEPRPAANFNAPEKIVMRQTGDSIVATIDNQQLLCLNNMHVIVPRSALPSLNFLLGIVNSRVMNWYYHTLNPEVGEALAEVKRTNVAQLPVRKIDLSKSSDRTRHDKLVSLVDKMLALVPKLRGARSETDRSTLQNAIASTDRQIDALVYDLYGLSPEEIELVQESRA